MSKNYRGKRRNNFGFRNLGISVLSLVLVLNFLSCSKRNSKSKEDFNASSVSDVSWMISRDELISYAFPKEEETINDSEIPWMISRDELIKYAFPKEEEKVVTEKKEETIPEMIDYILRKFDLTREEFDIIIAGCITEGMPGEENEDRINEGLNVASVLYNRCKNERWINYVRQVTGIKGNIGLFENYVAKGQFSTYDSGFYLRAIDQKSGPLYEALVKFFYYVDNIDPDRQNPDYEVRHNYCSFWAHYLGRKDGVQLVSPGGNDFFDPTLPEEAVPFSETFIYDNLQELYKEEHGKSLVLN